jgi:hypothetical protein
MTPRGLDMVKRMQALGCPIAEVRVWADVPFGPSQWFAPSGDVYADVCVAPWERLGDLDWTGIAGLPVQVVSKHDTDRCVALLADIHAAAPAKLSRTVLESEDPATVLEQFA